MARFYACFEGFLGADFWGIENCMPDFDDNKGVSLILINTAKGKDIFDNIKLNLIYRASNTTDCLQPQLLYPTEQSQKRDEFWNDYKEYGYKYIIKKYAGCGIKNQAKFIIVKILRKSHLINIVRKILKRGVNNYVQK